MQQRVSPFTDDCQVNPVRKLQTPNHSTDPWGNLFSKSIEKNLFSEHTKGFTFK